MDSDSLLEPEILMAYSDNKLDDLSLVEQIRASSSCKKWISEHRFVRILIRSEKNLDPERAMDPEKLEMFIAEDLNPQEMFEVEGILITNKDLLEKYLAQRSIHIAETKVEIPRELDQRVLNLIRESGSLSETSPTMIMEEPRPNVLAGLWDTLGNLLSPSHLAMAGGFAAALIIAVVGGKQIGLYGTPDFNPLIVASIENPEEFLSFRGSSEVQEISTNSDGELSSVVLHLVPALIDGLEQFNQEPSRESLDALILTLNQTVIQIEDETLKETLLLDNSFDASVVNAVQIQPSLWDQIETKSSKAQKILVSLIEQPDPKAAPSLKTSEAPATLKILYFSTLD
jgi:hypothetical protein